MLAAGILFTAVDLARCDCVAQGAQASRGFGAAARDRRSAATRMIFGAALQAALFGARNAQTAGAACSFEYCGLSDTPEAHADAMRAPRSGVAQRLPICVRLSKDAQEAPRKPSYEPSRRSTHCSGRPVKRGGRLVC